MKHYMSSGIFMSWRLGMFLLALLPLTVNAQTNTGQGKPGLVRVFTQQSEDFPISVRSTDSLVNVELLRLAEDSYRTFLQTMGLAELKAFALHLTWDKTPLAPPYDSFAAFPRKVELAADGRRTFIIMTRGPLTGDMALHEEVYRSSMACFLQALVWSENVVVEDGKLAEPPFWLREGLTQLMMKSRHETYLKIVQNYRKLERLPSLAEVQNWDTISEDFLQARWQQAFVYWLVRFGTAETVSKQALVLWLSSGNYATDRSFLNPDARNESWWTENVAQPPQPFKYYDWNQTVAKLRELSQVTLTVRPLPPEKKETTQSISITALPNPKRVKSLLPVKERIRDLANLQLWAHPAWSQIINLYSVSLEQWLAANTKVYEQCVAAIKQREEASTRYMSMVGDYMDWVIVNTPVSFNDLPVSSHSRITRELLQEEARLKVITVPDANGGGN